MKKLFVLASVVGVLFPTVASANQPIFSIVATNGQFLGVVSPDTYDNKSLCNRYGNYGSRYSDSSIFNHYSDYGSRYSDLSAYNNRAKMPPVLFKGRTPVGYVTKNTRIPGAMDPDAIKVMACGK